MLAIEVIESSSRLSQCRIEGLCADFNFDKTNDFTEKDGTQHPYTDNGFKRTDSEWKTAISWIIEGDPGPDPESLPKSINSVFTNPLVRQCLTTPLSTTVSWQWTSVTILPPVKSICEVPTDETLEEIYEAFITACKAKIPDDNAICVWKTGWALTAVPAGFFGPVASHTARPMPLAIQVLLLQSPQRRGMAAPR